MEEHYDAIIIGSGLSGLSAAVALAQKRKKVLVIEKHIKPGGYATNFKRKGFTFETSLHQVPGLKDGSPLYSILSKMGVMQKITPIELDYTFHVKFSKGTIAMGKNYLDELRKYFPEENEAIRKIEFLIDRIAKELAISARLALLPNPLHTFLCFWFTPTLFQYRNYSLFELLDEITKNAELQQLISIQWGYFGLPLKKISAIMYLSAWGGFIREGIFYIEGTSQSLSNAFCDRLRELNSEIIFSHEVVGIQAQANKVSGVAVVDLKNNNKFTIKAPVVVSNTDPYALSDLLPKNLNPLIAKYLRKADNFEPSTSATVAYIGLDCTMEELTGDHYIPTVQLSNDTESDIIFEKQSKGNLEGGFHTVVDYGAIDKSMAPKGKTVIGTLRNELMLDWENLSKIQYKNRKEKIKKEIIYDLENKFKGISEHIEVFELGTPRTMKRYTSNHKGSFNGFAYSTERVGMGKGGLPVRTPVKGLYISSAWSGALSGGFYGSIINGFTTAMQIS